MAPKLEYLFKRLRRERAPSLGFVRSEAAGGDKMIVAAVVNSAKPPAISSAVSAGAKIVLIDGDPRTDSGATESLVEAAGSALVGVIGPDLTDEPSAALAGLKELGVGFVVVEPDRTPARALNSEAPEIVVRLDLGDADPPPARLTTELAVSGAAISVLKQPDADPSLSMTDLALLRQFCANSRRSSIFLAHAGVQPEDVQLLHDHGVECIAVEAGAVASYVDAVRAIAPGSLRRQSDDFVPFLPKMHSAKAEDDDEDEDED